MYARLHNQLEVKEEFKPGLSFFQSQIFGVTHYRDTIVTGADTVHELPVHRGSYFRNSSSRDTHMLPIKFPQERRSTSVIWF